MRTLSHSEAEALLDCGLKHDLAYVGNTLGGHTLKSRIAHYYLRRGRAWGIGVQVWHTTGNLDAANSLMLTALEEDADAQKREGVYVAEEHLELWELLNSCLEHYSRTMPRLDAAEPERRLLVKVPGLRGWRLDARLDLTARVDGELYPFESKLRTSLSSVEQIVLSRQPRWYAAAWRQETGKTPAGFIADERLAQAPPPANAPVVWTNGSTPRKDGSQKDPPRPAKTGQTCPSLAYVLACQGSGNEPNPETVDFLTRLHDPRAYHGRHIIRFTERELDEALEQMRSAAHLIRLHERGVLTPIRNPSRFKCPGCAFRDICAEPTRDNAEVFFDLTTPKRLRGKEAAST